MLHLILYICNVKNKYTEFIQVFFPIMDQNQDKSPLGLRSLVPDTFIISIT